MPSYVDLSRFVWATRTSSCEPLSGSGGNFSVMILCISVRCPGFPHIPWTRMSKWVDIITYAMENRYKGKGERIGDGRRTFVMRRRTRDSEYSAIYDTPGGFNRVEPTYHIIPHPFHLYTSKVARHGLHVNAHERLAHPPHHSDHNHTAS